MVSESFAPHPYVIVAAPDHPLARRRRIPIDALLAERFVVRERGSDTWNSMEQAFGRRLAKLEIVMEVTSTETIKQAVLAGMGISFLSAHTIGMEMRVKSLVVLDVQGFPLLLNWYVVHRRNKRLPPVALAFKRFLLDDGAALIERITDVRLGAAPPPVRDPHGARPRSA
jgi:DNA-binding transcriptional LysR family regulator